MNRQHFTKLFFLVSATYLNGMECEKEKETNHPINYMPLHSLVSSMIDESKSLEEAIRTVRTLCFVNKNFYRNLNSSTEFYIEKLASFIEFPEIDHNEQEQMPACDHEIDQCKQEQMPACNLEAAPSAHVKKDLARLIVAIKLGTHGARRWLCSEAKNREDMYKKLLTELCNFPEYIDCIAKLERADGFCRRMVCTQTQKITQSLMQAYDLSEIQSKLLLNTFAIRSELLRYSKDSLSESMIGLATNKKNLRPGFVQK